MAYACFKINVIMGRHLPAGTGYAYYRMLEEEKRKVQEGLEEIGSQGDQEDQEDQEESQEEITA